MITTHKYQEKKWIDLNSPTKEEIDFVVSEFNLNPIISKDLLSPTPKQNIKISNNAIHIVLHTPSFKNSSKKHYEQEIDFVITKNDLITARYEGIDSLHMFEKEIEIIKNLNKDSNEHVFFLMIKKIYDFMFDEIEHIKDQIKNMEEKMFEDKEKDMVIKISKSSRNLLSFKRIISSHEEVLIELSEAGEDLFGERFKQDSYLILNTWEKMVEEIDDIKDMLDELRETNNSILSSKQNEITKVLTILAFLVIPSATISQIFGMNVENSPISGHIYDFWIIAGIMAIITLLIFVIFKIKKWL